MYVLVLALTLGNLPILSVHVPSGAKINELPHVQHLELCLAHGKHPIRIGCSDYIDLGVSRISLSEGLSWVSLPKASSLVTELAFLSKGFFPNLKLFQGAAAYF